ncbi:MAG: cyclase family protein [Bacteroidia bacterium]|nr:cyclase family protein [Bacteroidia bacterium]
MKITISIDNQSYSLGAPQDIGISLNFNGAQPNTYGVPKAKAQAFEGQGFVGDVSRGGSCNFEVYEFVPHCNGTHTECVGHLTEEKVFVHEVLHKSLLTASLITVALSTDSSNGQDSYQPPLEDGDFFVGLGPLAKALEGADKNFLEALIIRTLPNAGDKKSRNYMLDTCPFFSNEAMKFIVSLGVKHLLVDFPSVDRLFDDGKLSNHRIYWGIVEGEKNIPEKVWAEKTITEMVFVENNILDGNYLLELQIAPFMADASPSRPRLFPLKPEN